MSGADAWILSRLQAVITEVDALYERFEFAKIADVLYHFAWDEVCDWYLELAKISLAGPSADVTRRVLGEVLDALLRLLHPMIPFVTEALWTALTGGESVVIVGLAGGRPVARRRGARPPRSPQLQAVVTEVRRFRSDQGVKPSQRVPGAGDAVPGRGRRRSARCCACRSRATAFAPTASLTTSAGVTRRARPVRRHRRTPPNGPG